MIIQLRKSMLFTADPAERFARAYNLPEFNKAGEWIPTKSLWRDMWRRYKMLEYKPGELREFYLIRTKKHLSPQALDRWINKMEVYLLAEPMVRKGAETVVSSFFRDHEEWVMRELMRKMKTGVNRSSRALL